MVNVSAGDFYSKTQDLIFILCPIAGIFNCSATSYRHTKETNNYSYAFRGYEMAKLFL
jgi:hypothetical protein